MDEIIITRNGSRSKHVLYHYIMPFHPNYLVDFQIWKESPGFPYLVTKSPGKKHLLMYPLYSTQLLNPTIKSHKMSVPGILASAQAPKWGIGRKENSSSERGEKEKEGDSLPSFLAPIPRSARPARRFFFSPYTALGRKKVKETDQLNCGSWGGEFPPPPPPAYKLGGGGWVGTNLGYCLEGEWVVLDLSYLDPWKAELK